MYICIDFGGTNIRGALIDKNSTVHRRHRVRTQSKQGFDTVCTNLFTLIDELSTGIKLEAIGIGFPGTVSSDSHIVTAPNLGWNDIDLNDILFEKYNVKIKIDNDVNMAVRGESWIGAGKGFDDIFMLTVGTGVGGGFIINKSFYGGSKNNAGEIGHINVEKDGILCACGRKGCLEQYASATAMIDFVKDRLLNGEKSILERFKYDEIEAKEIFDGAKDQDRLCMDAVDRMCYYLSVGISTVVNLINPQCIIIGGGVSHAGDYFLQRIRHFAQELCLDYSYKDLHIRLAELGDEAGIFGCAYSFIEKSPRRSTSGEKV
jgi:glucokinase